MMKRMILMVALLLFGFSHGVAAAEPTLDLAPARWIWYPSQRTLSNTMVMFRKEFHLDRVPDRVDGWILADSRYLLYVNGERVQWGPAPFDPRWPEADPLDIRDYLREGENVIACQVLYYGLGDGTAPIGKPGFICRLNLGDQTLVSDGSWDVSVPRSWPAGQYKRYFQRSFQEEFDARFYHVGWQTTEYRPGVEWVKAMEMEGRADRSELSTDYLEYSLDFRANNRNTSEIRPRSIPLMREYEVPVSKLSESMWVRWEQAPELYFEMNTPHGYEVDRTACVASEGDGVWRVVPSEGRAALLTFEFAEQIVGFPSFTIDASEGTVVELMVHEAHEVGGPALLNTHFNGWTRFICREGENRFETFDYEGLRWMQLHIRNFEGEVTVREVGARRRIFPWPHNAEIRLSDKTIQKVMEATVNTLHNSAQDIIADGMGRERQQYSGDCGHQLHPIFSQFGDVTLPRRFLITFSQGLSTEGYFMDSWPACDRLSRVMQKQLGLTSWGPLLDHGVGFCFDNYNYYLYTGDTTHLGETLPRLLRFFDYLTTLVNPEDGLLPVENLGIPSVWIEHHDYKKNRHKILAFNLYTSAMCQRALAPLCEVTGHSEEAQRVRQFGEALQAACVDRFWSADRKVFVCNLPWEKEEGETRYHDRCLSTSVIFDLCPNGESGRAIELMAETPPEVGLSYPANAIWRLWALTQGHRMDVVLHELRTRWAGMESVDLNNTLQESWTAKPDGRDQWSHCPVAPLIMLHQGIAGIRLLEPAYARFEIVPQFGDLTEVACSVQTVRGAIDFEATGKMGNRRLRLTIPRGTTAELELHESERVNLPEISRNPEQKTRRYQLQGGSQYEIRLRHM